MGIHTWYSSHALLYVAHLLHVSFCYVVQYAFNRSSLSASTPTAVQGSMPAPLSTPTISCNQFCPTYWLHVPSSPVQYNKTCSQACLFCAELQLCVICLLCTVCMLCLLCLASQPALSRRPVPPVHLMTTVCLLC